MSAGGVRNRRTAIVGSHPSAQNHGSNDESAATTVEKNKNNKNNKENRKNGMALSKLGLELGAVAGLAAVMLGGFYYQGTRVDAFAERLDKRITDESARLDTRIDDVNTRIDGVNERIDRVNERIDRVEERINGVDRRLARIEGLLEGWVSTRPSESDGGSPG